MCVCVSFCTMCLCEFVGDVISVLCMHFVFCNQLGGLNALMIWTV